MTRAGIGVLPFLQPSKHTPRGILNCDFCLETTGEETRRTMGCGWLPRERWLPGERVPVGVPPYKGDVCAGWLVRQPAVIEGAAAAAALKQGALELLDPAVHQTTWEAAQEGLRAFAVWEQQELKRSSG